MPTHTVKIAPGVNSEFTPSLNEGAYQSTNLIRFAPSGLPQKLGGWTKFYPTPINSPITALHAWEDLSASLHLAVGATSQLSVITNGLLDDITPQINVTNPAVSFSTVSGQSLVTINDVGSNATAYDSVIIGTQVPCHARAHGGFIHDHGGGKRYRNRYEWRCGSDIHDNDSLAYCHRGIA